LSRRDAACSQMKSPLLALRRSLGDCGNPREQSISWIATSLLAMTIGKMVHCSDHRTARSSLELWQ
jgi:hypothetical protein